MKDDKEHMGECTSSKPIKQTSKTYQHKQEPTTAPYNSHNKEKKTNTKKVNPTASMQPQYKRIHNQTPAKITENRARINPTNKHATS